MTTLREAAQQTLEALEWVNRYGSDKHGPSAIGAENTLRAALEQPDRCSNCASLEAQNTYLDRKLAELERRDA